MENLQKLIIEGKQRFDNRQYKEAESFLKRVIEKSTKFADVHNMLGVIAHIDGRFASAIDHFERALSINPNYTEATLNLAVLYNDLGQYAEAKKLYAKLKQKADTGRGGIEPVIRGKLSNLHADIGNIYRSIGLFKFAIDEYRKALDLNPNYLDIRTKLGNALRENSEHKAALAEFKKVLTANSNYFPALIGQGVTFYTMNQVEDAKTSWKKVLKLEPGNEYAEMYLKLCESTQPQKKTKKAKKAAKKK